MTTPRKAPTKKVPAKAPVKKAAPVVKATSASPKMGPKRQGKPTIDHSGCSHPRTPAGRAACRAAIAAATRKVYGATGK